jgi:hypothetical protein
MNGPTRAATCRCARGACIPASTPHRALSGRSQAYGSEPGQARFTMRSWDAVPPARCRREALLWLGSRSRQRAKRGPRSIKMRDRCPTAAQRPLAAGHQGRDIRQGLGPPEPGPAMAGQCCIARKALVSGGVGESAVCRPTQESRRLRVGAPAFRAKRDAAPERHRSRAVTKAGRARSERLGAHGCRRTSAYGVCSSGNTSTTP